MTRCDPRDGQWYTKNQFIDFYGGEEEWHKAVLTQHTPEVQDESSVAAETANENYDDSTAVAESNYDDSNLSEQP